MKSTLLVVIIAVAISCSDAGAKFAGPFNVQVKQPFVCEDEGTKQFRYTNVTVRKKTKNLYTLSSLVIMKLPFDDRLSVEANFAVWGNGGWKPNFLIMEYKDACLAFATVLPGMFQQILDNNSLSGCPIPAGNYTLVDADASPKVDLKSLPYNKYKASFHIKKHDGTIVGCIGLITDIVPKNKN